MVGVFVGNPLRLDWSPRSLLDPHDPAVGLRVDDSLLPDGVDDQLPERESRCHRNRKRSKSHRSGASAGSRYSG
jgi:hypothetical protein